MEWLLTHWKNLKFTDHSSAIRVFYDAYINAMILMKRGWYDLVKILITRMEKILEKYPMPHLHIKLLHILADYHFHEKRPEVAMKIINNLLYHLNKRGMKKLEYINCYFKKCRILLKTNKALNSFIEIKEGITLAENSGFVNQALKFKFLLVQLLIDNRNISEATDILQGNPPAPFKIQKFPFFSETNFALELSTDILHRPTHLKMEYYYHKTILLMSMVKDNVLPTEEFVLDNVLKNISEALKCAVLLEDFKNIKKYLFICANIYSMKYEKNKRNNVAVELKKFKMMEAAWKKLANRIFIFEEGKCCLKLHAQIHSLMGSIGNRVNAVACSGDADN